MATKFTRRWPTFQGPFRHVELWNRVCRLKFNYKFMWRQRTLQTQRSCVVHLIYKSILSDTFPQNFGQIPVAFGQYFGQNRGEICFLRKSLKLSFSALICTNHRSKLRKLSQDISNLEYGAGKTKIELAEEHFVRHNVSRNLAKFL